MPDAPREIVITGITESGTTFRPSDWAERLCGAMSLFGEDQRISYSPFVRPIVSGGVRCVLVDARLGELQAQAFDFLMGFARDNALAVRSGREGLRGEMRSEDQPSGPAAAGQAQSSPVTG
jgi:hypothetical protein